MVGLFCMLLLYVDAKECGTDVGILVVVLCVCVNQRNAKMNVYCARVLFKQH